MGWRPTKLQNSTACWVVRGLKCLPTCTHTVPTEPSQPRYPTLESMASLGLTPLVRPRSHALPFATIFLQISFRSNLRSPSFRPADYLVRRTGDLVSSLRYRVQGEGVRPRRRAKREEECAAPSGDDRGHATDSAAPPSDLNHLRPPRDGSVRSFQI